MSAVIASVAYQLLSMFQHQEFNYGEQSLIKGLEREEDETDGEGSKRQEKAVRTSADAIIGPDTSQREIFSSWALFIMIMLLIAALFTSYMLQQKKIEAVHETVISIFAGRWSA
jgi:hypothetical protein